MPADATHAASQAVREAARAHDRDRYLAALLAPRSSRDDLIALAAFSGEIAHVARSVREPMIGEIRLQWWWDAIERGEPGSGHPVADAAIDLVRRGRLDKGEGQALIDAYRDDLHAEPASSDRALAARIDATEGRLFRLAGALLAAEHGTALTQDQRAALYAAAQGYGLSGLLFDLSARQALGRPPLADFAAGGQGSTSVAEVAARLARLARTARANARGVAAGLDREDARLIAPALLPAALTEPYLRAFEAAGAGSGAARPSITPLRRVWTLFRARHTGRP